MGYSLVRPLLFRLDAENAHHHTLAALDFVHRLGLSGLVAGRPVADPARVMGLDFPNRVGLAAGLDKNGAHIDALAALGFGFIEIGTVTPRPQPGNPRPRLFRLPASRAIINRMGFNNEGVERLVMNVAASRYRGVLGINIGKNFDTPLPLAARDYAYCLRKVYTSASYVTVNISSPNTANLRQLQGAQELRDLLGKLATERDELAQRHGKRVPLAVKVAPDLGADDLPAMAATFVELGIDAVIATNTTLSRDGVASEAHAGETGGLSGAPLTQRATQTTRLLCDALAGAVPVIAAGGIMAPADARAKIDAGASLVQLYSGLVYAGPRLVAACARAIASAP